MTEQTNSTRSTIGLIFLGVPGVVLFLGGLWIWFVVTYGFATNMFHLGFYAKLPRERLIAALFFVPLSPPIGYSMIVLAANMTGIQRYRLLPRHAVLQALLDASHVALVSLTLCLLILTLTPSGYPRLHIPTFIACAALIPLVWFLRRFAQKEQRKWQAISSNT